MPCQTFHHLGSLPTELRWTIWEYALPFRVAEYDPPYGFVDGRDGRLFCDPRKTTAENTKFPVIATVCRESRFVAMKQRVWLRGQVPPSLKWSWVQPRRDTLHLNFSPQSFHDVSEYPSPTSAGMVVSFFHIANRVKVPTSINAEMIYPFRLNPPNESTEWYDVLFDDDFINDKVHKWTKEIIELTRCIQLFDNNNEAKIIDVVMAVVPLHGDKEAARRSGLFGVLGDVPIQIVALNDITRLSNFKVFFQKYIMVDKKKVQTLFQLLKGPQFQHNVNEWRAKAEWMILAHI
ncbi:hypothetical protein N7456_006426 [Penicillium angulare]|uniref:2EXR domain-containing protein n=1 Tax=Penicillium angulare TaxID=116970 RepID=A0A9W9FHS1_9EURO|nr:hypothetical protein N7456_006426 [Penicillium angulare]